VRSAWSTPTTFTTAVLRADTPTNVSTSGGGTDESETPRLTGSDFSVSALPSDTHESSDWQIATDAGFTDIVWEIADNTVNKTSVVVAPGYLQQGGNVYYWRVRYKGVQSGKSLWSNPTTFTTAQTFGELMAGMAEVFNNGYTSYTSIIKLSESKAIVAYGDQSSSGYGTAVVLDISGTTITGGSEYIFNNGYTIYTSITALSESKAIVAYGDDSNGQCGTAKVITYIS
jgi:hypothetical protein